ncbi:MAG: hypothetical protein ACW97A_10900, partial [Candidatus Thorarchaeota archaeon]
EQETAHILSGIYTSRAVHPLRESKALSNRLLAVGEKSLGFRDVEIAHVINQDDGTHLLRVEGDPTSVNFNRAEISAMKDNTMTHGHPGVSGLDVPFSSDDLAFAIINDLFEIRAVSDRAVYRLQRPKSGWPSVSRSRESLQFAHNSVRSVHDRLGFSSDNPPSSEVHSLLIHNMIDRWAVDLDIAYSREEL